MPEYRIAARSTPFREDAPGTFLFPEPCRGKTPFPEPCRGKPHSRNLAGAKPIPAALPGQRCEDAKNAKEENVSNFFYKNFEKRLAKIKKMWYNQGVSKYLKLRRLLEMSDNKKAVAKEPAKETENRSAAAGAAKKPAAKPEPVAKVKAKTDPTIHDATTKLWSRLDKADTSGVKGTIAVQVELEGNGVFYIEVKEGGKAINQTAYQDRSGTLYTTLDEILRIASNPSYDFVKAIEEGKIHYYGDLGKALALLSFFK
jgi:hypothetical protein